MNRTTTHECVKDLGAKNPIEAVNDAESSLTDMEALLDLLRQETRGSRRAEALINALDREVASMRCDVASIGGVVLIAH